MNEYQGDDAALRRLLLLAQQGDADAQFELGRSYTIGRGVAEDDQEAVFWYRQAAEQGHVGGQFGRGRSSGRPRSHVLVSQGRRTGRRKCPARTRTQLLQWQGRSSGRPRKPRSGFVKPPSRDTRKPIPAGLLLCRRRGRSSGRPRSRVLVRNAAEQEHAEAQFWLGHSYDSGHGVAEDDQEAMFWYRPGSRPRGPERAGRQASRRRRGSHALRLGRPRPRLGGRRRPRLREMLTPPARTRSSAPPSLRVLQLAVDFASLHKGAPVPHCHTRVGEFQSNRF